MNLQTKRSSHVSRLPGQWQGHNSNGIDEEPIKPTSTIHWLVPMVSFTLRNPTHLWNQAARASALYLQVRAIFWNKNWRYERQVGENERATGLSDCKPFYLFCPCRPLSSLELRFNGFAGPAWQIFLAWKLDSVLVLFSKNLSCKKIQTKTNNHVTPCRIWGCNANKQHSAAANRAIKTKLHRFWKTLVFFAERLKAGKTGSANFSPKYAAYDFTKIDRLHATSGQRKPTSIPEMARQSCNTPPHVVGPASTNVRRANLRWKQLLAK